MWLLLPKFTLLAAAGNIGIGIRRFKHANIGHRSFSNRYVAFCGVISPPSLKISKKINKIKKNETIKLFNY